MNKAISKELQQTLITSKNNRGGTYLGLAVKVYG